MVSTLPAFRRMRLVPFDEPVGAGAAATKVRRLQEAQIRNYDPIVSAMADLLPAIEKPKVQRGRKMAAVAVHNANLQRFKSLQMQRAETLDAKPIAETATAAETIEPPSLTTVSVPQTYKQKLERLLQHLDEHAGAIGRTASDELVIDGVTHRGTSLAGAIRSLYVNTSSPAPGTRQLVARLRKLGVPKELLSSHVAQTLYDQIGSGIQLPGKRGRVLHVYK